MELLHNSELLQLYYHKACRRYQIKSKKLNSFNASFLSSYLLFFSFFFFPRARVCGQEKILAINLWSDLIELIFRTSNSQYQNVKFKQLFPFLLSTRGEYCNNEVWSTSCKRGAEVCSFGWRHSEL